MSPRWVRPLARAWDRLSLYLPVLLMALLALASYWMVRRAPQLPQPAAAAAPDGEPDQVMRDFAVRTFDADGRLRSEVFGAEARHFPARDRVEIDAPRLRQLDAHGVLTLATARRAISNDDGSEVQLIGDARVVREASRGGSPRTEFRGEFLHVFGNTERIRSDQPVELRRGANRFSADSLQYDHVEQVMDLRGNVRVTLQPRPRGEPE